jgi:uncharacterized membrane protein YbhN (UPF0104 family)
LNGLRLIWAWLKWPLAVGIIATLMWLNRQGFHELSAQEKHWPMLGLAFILVTSGLVLTFVRWHWLVRALDFDFRLLDACRLGLMGSAVGYIGGGTLGGDSFKAVALASGQASRRIVIVATVFLDRIIGLLALFWVGAFGSWLTRNMFASELHTTVRTFFWLSSIIGSIGLLLFLIPAVTHSRLISWAIHLPLVGGVFHQLLDGVALYQRRPWVLVGATCMAMVGHSLMITGLYCCALGLGGWAPSLAAHLYLTPAAEIVGLIPTPSGIGPQEFGIQEGYGAVAGTEVSVEAAKRAGFFAGIAFRIILMIVAAVGAVFYFARRGTLTTPTASPPSGTP